MRTRAAWGWGVLGIALSTSSCAKPRDSMLDSSRDANLADVSIADIGVRDIGLHDVGLLDVGWADTSVLDSTLDAGSANDASFRDATVDAGDAGRVCNPDNFEPNDTPTSVLSRNDGNLTDGGELVFTGLTSTTPSDVDWFAFDTDIYRPVSHRDWWYAIRKGQVYFDSMPTGSEYELTVFARCPAESTSQRGFNGDGNPTQICFNGTHVFEEGMHGCRITSRNQTGIDYRARMDNVGCLDANGNLIQSGRGKVMVRVRRISAANLCGTYAIRVDE